MFAVTFIVILVVGIFALAMLGQWRRETAWRRRRQQHDDD
jgi:hypothetical protein